MIKSIILQGFIFMALIASCKNEVNHQEAIIEQEPLADTKQNKSLSDSVQIEPLSDTLGIKINYTTFNPKSAENININGFDIEHAYSLDSIVILTAYSDGDLATSSAPVNWGDRLILMKNDSIYFQSKPVGDPYQYEPFFYRNPSNNKVVIICQLGNEENYGGEAFLYENGTIEFMGQIKVESPYETPNNTNLIEITRVSEIENSIYFEFEADSLIDLTNDDWFRVKNDGIKYLYNDHTFTLIGL
jgi:hypothetical protein